MSDSAIRRVMYVGSKPTKQDNVAGSGLTWNGQGDVLPVPVTFARRLCAFPDVWRDVTELSADEAKALGIGGEASGADPATRALQQELGAVRAELAEVNEAYEKLKATNARLRKENKVLKEENDKLKGLPPDGKAKEDAPEPLALDLTGLTREQLREYAARELQLPLDENLVETEMRHKITAHIQAQSQG